jgi:hypothetical protein
MKKVRFIFHKIICGGWKRSKELYSPSAIHLATPLVHLVANKSFNNDGTWWANCHSAIHGQGYTFASGQGFKTECDARKWAESEAIKVYSKESLTAFHPNMVKFDYRPS